MPCAQFSLSFRLFLAGFSILASFCCFSLLFRYFFVGFSLVSTVRLIYGEWRHHVGTPNKSGTAVGGGDVKLLLVLRLVLRLGKERLVR